MQRFFRSRRARPAAAAPAAPAAAPAQEEAPPPPPPPAVQQGLPAPPQQQGLPRLFMGAPPPPPSAMSMALGAPPPPPSMATLAKQKASTGGFWTQRGLPGFKLTVPADRIKNAPYKPAAKAPAATSAFPAGSKSVDSEVTLAALQQDSDDAALVLRLLTRLRVLCRGSEEARAATLHAGGATALCDVLTRHSADEAISTAGCAVLRFLAGDGHTTVGLMLATRGAALGGALGGGGGDSRGDALMGPPSGFTPAAVDAAVVGVVAAMLRHPQSIPLAEQGVRCLYCLCAGRGADGARVRRLATERGALTAIAAAVSRHTPGSHLLRDACRLLQAICVGDGAEADARRTTAVAVGIFTNLAAMLRAVRARPALPAHAYACVSSACVSSACARTAECVGCGRHGCRRLARRSRVHPRAPSRVCVYHHAPRRTRTASPLAHTRASCARLVRSSRAARAAWLASPRAPHRATARRRRCVRAPHTLAQVPRLVEAVEEGAKGVVSLCSGGGDFDARRQSAVDASILRALAEAMAGCRASSVVQEWGCKAIGLVVAGADRRRATAAEHGAIGALVSAVQAHPGSAYVLEHGLYSLRQLCRGYDQGVAARAEVALHLGAMAIMSQAMTGQHRTNATIGEACCELISALGACGSVCGLRAASEGAIELIVQSIKEHPSLLTAGRAALAAVVSEHAQLIERARASGAEEEWLPRPGPG